MIINIANVLYASQNINCKTVGSAVTRTSATCFSLKRVLWLGFPTPIFGLKSYAVSKQEYISSLFFLKPEKKQIKTFTKLFRRGSRSFLEVWRQTLPAQDEFCLSVDIFASSCKDVPEPCGAGREVQGGSCLSGRQQLIVLSLSLHRCGTCVLGAWEASR